MHTVTGVEIGVDRCVIARVRRASDRVQLSAVHGLAQGDWDPDTTLASNLRRLRRGRHYPRRARVVAWHVDGAGNGTEPTGHREVAPLVEAGFVLDAVLSPVEALLALANSRTRAPAPGGEVWLALNRSAAAIAIVEMGRLLFSRVFAWNYRPADTVRGELLQRYSLVSHLAPEIRHALDVVRQEHGTTVTAIVTCGDLPDLRSLTMPLIEELDMEVETLDTLEGLSIDGMAAGVNGETTPALRLISAVALARPQSLPRRPRHLLATAAVVAIVVAGGWLVMREVRGPQAGASPVRPAPRPAAAAPPMAVEQAPIVAPPAAAKPLPARETGHVSDPGTPAATMGRQESATAGRAAFEEPASRNVPRRRVRADRVPLRDPLPVVNSILVAPDRRLAVANGEIVREGDAVGRRVLVRIEPGALVLREPSGLEVRVAMRRRTS